MRLPLAGLALGALLSVLAVVMALAFETRSWRLLGALAGLWLVVVVEAAAGAAAPPPQLEKAAGSLTCLKDFLELDHPRWPERARLQKTRRALEARAEAAR